MYIPRLFWTENLSKMADESAAYDIETLPFIVKNDGAPMPKSTDFIFALKWIVFCVAIVFFLVIFSEVGYIAVLDIKEKSTYAPTISPTSIPTSPPTNIPSNFVLYSDFDGGSQLPMNYTCDFVKDRYSDPYNADGDYEQNPPLWWYHEPNGTIEYLGMMTSHIKSGDQDYDKVDWSFWNYSTYCVHSIPIHVPTGYCGLQFGGTYSLKDDGMWGTRSSS